MLQREVGRKETRIFPLYRRSGRQVINVALDTELPSQLKIGIAVDRVYPGLVFTGFGIVQNDAGCPAMVHIGTQVQLRPFSRRIIRAEFKADAVRSVRVGENAVQDGICEYAVDALDGVFDVLEIGG